MHQDWPLTGSWLRSEMLSSRGNTNVECSVPALVQSSFPTDYPLCAATLAMGSLATATLRKACALSGCENISDFEK